MQKMDNGMGSMAYAKQAANRIVFQLDMAQDTLRYCHWVGSPDEDRTEGEILDFQKALRSAKLVHPEDVGACEQILRKQADGLSITTSEVRIRNGSAGYPRYRLYSVFSKDAQGNALCLNGVLEAVQHEKAAARRTRIQAQQDSLFRHAITGNSSLSMGFDCVTGKRLVSDLDVIPPWLNRDSSLRNLVHTLFSQSLIPEDRHRLEAILDKNLEQDGAPMPASFFSDCRLRDLSRQSTEYRWYRVYHTYTGNLPNRHACFYLTIMDVHEIKTKEQQMVEQAFYDSLTGMLNRSAFENRIAGWLERMKREAVFTYLCAVVVLLENPIEIHNRHGRPYLAERVVQLSKMVKAFIQPHEMCCRYGMGEFAMVLAGNNRETMDERLNMLRFACNAQKSEMDGLRILFGCNLENAAESEQGDMLLEKAHQTLLSIRFRDAQKGERLAYSDFAAQDQARGNPNSQEGAGRQAEAHHILIRTFGHFDVFVDGEAVLFNHPKAKELFALLVDRRGGFVSATEAISCLWEDEPANSTTLARCRKAALYMKQTLARYGVDTILETVNGKRRVRADQCDCDYYHYLQQGAGMPHKRVGSYMNEYSWAEYSAVDD